MGGVLVLFLWPIRKNMRVLRWGIVAVLVGLEIVMKAPVWFVLGHIDLSTGWKGKAADSSGSPALSPSSRSVSERLGSPGRRSRAIPRRNGSCGSLEPRFLLNSWLISGSITS